jgi:4-hydroxybenzoate polyprenyltransferase
MTAASLRSLLRCMRPRQWVKNVVVFAPLVFGVAFLDSVAVLGSILAFLSLCLLSSAVYIGNDIRDREEDREHPTKRHRPIACGDLSVREASAVCLILLAIGLGVAYALGLLALAAALIFLGINALYIWGGKQVAILDVMLIGASFVARVLVGSAAIFVPPSAWLLLTLFFLATYMGFGKRDAELRRSEQGRVARIGYVADFLRRARTATLSVTLALYTLYTFASPFGEGMALTIPFVFFALLRYEAITDTDSGENDGPSHHVYEDRHLQVAFALWAITALLVVCTSV